MSMSLGPNLIGKTRGAPMFVVASFDFVKIESGVDDISVLIERKSSKRSANRECFMRLKSIR